MIKFKNISLNINEREFVMKKLLLCTVVLGVFCFAGCKYRINLADSTDYTESVGYWESEIINGAANTITVKLSKDAEFLAWTKENGEFMEIPMKPGQSKFSETLIYNAGEHVFTFKEPGTYILNIRHESSNVDLRGKIVVGEQAVKVDDKDFACSWPQQAIFSVKNDSKAYGPGNEINELIYVEYDKSESWKKCIYNLKYKYDNLKLKPGDSITLLFPAKFSNSSEDVKKSGFILRPFINGEEKNIYPGNTTCRPNKYSIQFFDFGQSNCKFSYIGNNQFECEWK